MNARAVGSADAAVADRLDLSAEAAQRRQQAGGFRLSGQLIEVWIRVGSSWPRTKRIELPRLTVVVLKRRLTAAPRARLSWNA